MTTGNYRAGQRVQGANSGRLFTVVYDELDTEGQIVLKNDRGIYATIPQRNLRAVDPAPEEASTTNRLRIDNHEQRLLALEEEVAGQRDRIRSVEDVVRSLTHFKARVEDWTRRGSNV